MTLAHSLESAASINRSVSQAHPGKGGAFGLGLMLGEPTGISAKYWTSGSTAFAFGVASSWNDYVELLVDHDWHFPSAFSANGPVVPYIGVGAGLFFSTYNRYAPYPYNSSQARFFGYTDSSFAFGVRIPIGIEFLPSTVPMGLFVEVVPEVLFYPGTYGFVQAVIGGRYYF